METVAKVPLLRPVEAELEEKIRNRSAKAAVVGLGHVGLPLAAELIRAGYHVTAIDRDPDKIRRLREGDSYIGDVSSATLAGFLKAERIAPLTDDAALADCDVVSICVPTPLRKTKDPDMSYVVAATETLRRHIHPGMLIILESTTYPGTTEELVRPILEESGLKAGEDFFLCFSPERVDPGNREYGTRNIPKVIGGITRRCTEIGALYYSQVMERVVPVTSSRVAEMVKLLENTFRMINIGLANEMALMCDRMGIDVWEVIEAAATKPFGFMPFYPGPGVGGHCIPVDPLYLSWKTKQAGHEPQFIELAARINALMPRHIVEKVQTALNDRGKPVNGSRVHIIGVAYKPDVADTRESPALDIMSLLEERGAKLSYTDPWVPRIEFCSRELLSTPIETAAPASDCVVLVTDHSGIDYSRLVHLSPLIVDTRNRLRGHRDRHIIRL